MTADQVRWMILFNGGLIRDGFKTKEELVKECVNRGMTINGRTVTTIMGLKGKIQKY